MSSFHRASPGIGPGNYVTIAAHPLQNNGLLKRPAHYVTDIAGGCIQAAELGRPQTLEEDIGANSKLRYACERGRVALYHCSDAVKLPASGSSPSDRELGYRFTVLKMAAPTLESDDPTPLVVDQPEDELDNRFIALEAGAQYGKVYAEGAIEDPEVREAILKTLDGGKDAFRLRRAKYGF